MRAIKEKFDSLDKEFPKGGKGSMIITRAEAKMMVTAMHGSSIAQAFSDGVECIENMLLQQLISAIGKIVTPVDFTKYLVYHNRKLFKGTHSLSDYQSPPFRFLLYISCFLFISCLPASSLQFRCSST